MSHYDYGVKPGKEQTVKNGYSKVFRAFSDENRLRILELLREGEQCACILLEDLSINQPTLSHHMKILCASGIVTGRRVGKWVYYSINDSGLNHAKDLLTRLMNGEAGLPESTTSRLYTYLRLYGSAIGAFFAHIISKNFNMMMRKIAVNGEGSCCCQ
jgi:ArsR family transcriptional regulator